MAKKKSSPGSSRAGKGARARKPAATARKPKPPARKTTAKTAGPARKPTAPARKPTATVRKAKAPARKRPTAAPALDVQGLTEELEAARGELARIGTEENVIKRDLDARLSEATSAADRLRAELEAVRVDLKTALADLEIARAAEQRAADRALAMTRELTEARDSQRRADHAGDAARDEAHANRRQIEALRAELQSARSAPAAAPAPAAGPTENAAPGSQAFKG